MVKADTLLERGSPRRESCPWDRRPRQPGRCRWRCGSAGGGEYSGGVVDRIHRDVVRAVVHDIQELTVRIHRQRRRSRTRSPANGEPAMGVKAPVEESMAYAGQVVGQSDSPHRRSVPAWVQDTMTLVDVGFVDGAGAIVHRAGLRRVGRLRFDRDRIGVVVLDALREGEGAIRGRGSDHCPELSCSTRPWPERPVKVPPTVYLAPIWQPMIAAATERAIIHARCLHVRLSAWRIWRMPGTAIVMKSFKKLQPRFIVSSVTRP